MLVLLVILKIIKITLYKKPVKLFGKVIITNINFID